MSDSTGMKRGELVALGCLIAIGLIVGGWALGAQIKAVRLGESLRVGARFG
jgi:hypothetical protein